MGFSGKKKRTHRCGDLGKDHEGQKVVLMGWVHSRRDLGSLIFIDLRDRQGLVQIVLDPSREGMELSKKLRNEFVITVEGKVRLRPPDMVNSQKKTGAIEVEAESVEILSSANPPPFVVGDPRVSELMGLKYRYLSLRDHKIQNCLQLRHRVTKLVRDFLSQEGFWEVETPILYKTTPEGARDYLVPSRLSPGEFYALPQSPQTLKQLLMIGGLDSYFQIARCFRDEDLRADRQPEFSQIDMEMAFVDEEDVRAINEKLLKAIWKEFKSVDLDPIPLLDYNQSLCEYGTDRPDLRNPLKIVDCSEQLKSCGFRVFDSNLSEGGVVRGLGLPLREEISRSAIDKWIQAIKIHGARGLVWIKKQGEKYKSSADKFLSQDLLSSVYKQLCPQGFGLGLLVSDKEKVVAGSLAFLRQSLAKQFKLIDDSRDRFCWVVNFPLFDYDEKENRFVSCHHPFTMPKDGDLELLKSGDFQSVSQVRAKAYDLVCNGSELAGGSVRIHSKEIQSAVFKALGLTEELARKKFGYFLEALSYGTPPHGGIAWGLDRLVMILAGTSAIRDVIAYPKTTKAQCLMSGSPSKPDSSQLRELGIKF